MERDERWMVGGGVMREGGEGMERERGEEKRDKKVD